MNRSFVRSLALGLLISICAVAAACFAIVLGVPPVVAVAVASFCAGAAMFFVTHMEH